MTRRLWLAVLLVASLASPALEAQDSQAGQSADREAAVERPAPVEVGGEPAVWVAVGAGPYTAQQRADRIAGRVHDAIRDSTIRDLTVTVVETDGASELRVGSRLLMVVTARDAAAFGVPRVSLAQQYARELEPALRAERNRYAPATLERSALYGAVATGLLVLAVWVIRRLARASRGVARRSLSRKANGLRALHLDRAWVHRVATVIDRGIAVARVVLLLLAFHLYLTYVLGLFPWTRAVSIRLLGYVLTPIRAVVVAFAGYLPNLLFVIVIAAVVYVAIRLVGFFFKHIEDGRLTFPTFPAEWASPTNKIARVLLLAFGVVVAFPYLPASQSPAFAGVSVFMGVLVSLASSSALSNMIAGIVLTYTGAFRVGDRVKLGDAFGDIVETSLLATRVRTIKNEQITIPNSIALGSAVTNYTRDAATLGLILHTSVTIGYDAPWRKVHELLLEAARATPGVLRDPRPFVWQTALNDFYVTYEINAYTAEPRAMVETYAALHAAIQDAFYAAGVEIMSPHVTSIRDGNTVAIPPAFRDPGYRAPAFRVETDASRVPHER